MKDNKTRIKQCAKCGDMGIKLQPCESGHICNTCLEKWHAGRDETTRIIKATRVYTLDGEQMPQPIEITVPRNVNVTSPSQPEKPLAKLTPEIIAKDAEAHRHELLNYLGNETTALALDAENSMQPQNSFEQMLVHLMAVAYKSSMDMSSKACFAYDISEKARLVNLSARMMESFQKGALTFQRLRGGGNQHIVVQHVSVTEGGQAVIGNVHTGGGKPK